MVGRAGALAALAGAVAAALPAGAAVGVPGSVTGTDRSLRAGCHYARLLRVQEWSETAQISGFAVSVPDARVRVRCTVTPRSGIVTAVEASGFDVAAVSDPAEVYGAGPTTICVEAWADHTIDVQEHVSSCATYRD